MINPQKLFKSNLQTYDMLRDICITGTVNPCHSPVVICSAFNMIPYDSVYSKDTNSLNIQSKCCLINTIVPYNYLQLPLSLPFLLINKLKKCHKPDCVFNNAELYFLPLYPNSTNTRNSINTFNTVNSAGSLLSSKVVPCSMLWINKPYFYLLSSFNSIFTEFNLLNQLSCLNRTLKCTSHAIHDELRLQTVLSESSIALSSHFKNKLTIEIETLLAFLYGWLSGPEDSLKCRFCQVTCSLTTHINPILNKTEQFIALITLSHWNFCPCFSLNVKVRTNAVISSSNNDSEVSKNPRIPRDSKMNTEVHSNDTQLNLLTLSAIMLNSQLYSDIQCVVGQLIKYYFNVDIHTMSFKLSSLTRHLNTYQVGNISDHEETSLLSHLRSLNPDLKDNQENGLHSYFKAVTNCTYKVDNGTLFSTLINFNTLGTPDIVNKALQASLLSRVKRNRNTTDGRVNFSISCILTHIRRQLSVPVKQCLPVSVPGVLGTVNECRKVIVPGVEHPEKRCSENANGWGCTTALPNQGPKSVLGPSLEFYSGRKIRPKSPREPPSRASLTQKSNDALDSLPNSDILLQRAQRFRTSRPKH